MYMFKKRVDFLVEMSGNIIVDHIVLSGHLLCWIMQLISGLKYFTKLVTESGFLL